MPLLPPPRSKFPLLLFVTVSLTGFCILLVRVQSFSSFSRTAKPVSIAMTSSSYSSSSSSDARPHSIDWKPLGPNNFPSVVSPDDGCQYAKDDDYLRAVVESWKHDLNSAATTTTTTTTATTTALPEPRAERVETTPWVYYDDRGTPLYGHVVRPVTDNNDDDGRRRPGILLFHTAAGPQDVFLFHKAATLASSELGSVVLVCDVLSDRDGWAWKADRTRYNRVREDLFRDGAALLRARVEAAVRTLVDPGDNDDDVDDPGSGSGGGLGLGVDPDRLAALGWCFGAHPLLELTILQHQQDPDVTEERGTTGGGGVPAFSASALVSYHGVYRREDPPVVPARTAATTVAGSPNREVLICTGASDPFVAPEDLEFARTTMEEQGYGVRILEFDGAKHGFTNPAQDFNANPAFRYDETAATTSWEATVELLKRKLLSL